MKKYFVILIIQIFFIVIIGYLLKKILKINDVESFLIPASCFMIIFLGVQIMQSKKFFSNAVSKEGIIGARLAGVIVTGWLLPLCIGYAFINPVAVILFGISMICLLLGRKYIKIFFVASKWKFPFYLVYMGLVCGGSAVEIVLFNLEGKVTESVPFLYRMLVCMGLIVWNILTIPYNSPIAKFATANYRNLYDK